MNAVEKIEAAIAKLGAARSRASDGPWADHAVHLASGTVTVSNDVGRSVAHHVAVVDADLIVTLHRTIDAQLAILRHGVTHWQMIEASPMIGMLDADRDALRLAAAILGGGPNE